MARFNVQQFTDVFISVYGPDFLLTLFYLDLVVLIQDLKKRLVFEVPGSKPG